MKILKIFVWEFYFILFSFLTLHKTLTFFNPGSGIHKYYFYLNAFDPFFIIFYVLSLNQILITILHCLALFLWIHKIRFLNQSIWQIFFIMRVIFDITGHSYEINQLVSVYHFNPLTAAFFFAGALCPFIPSYIASFTYAVSEPIWQK